MTALAGLIVAALLWWGLKAFGRSNPQQVSRALKMAGGVAALAVAALLALRGRLDMAALAGGAGAWLLGWSAPPGWIPPGLSLPGMRKAKPPAASEVRSGTLVVRLDHETGAVSGDVVAGPLAGRSLESLSRPDLLDLLQACLVGDVEGARLLEAYLDRRAPGWREDAHRDADRRRGADLQGGAMAEQEAYEILGLQPGADADAVVAAHRNLMKRLHPDGGGSTYLASRVNQAKDALLNRHR